jgi:hypothetical protein
MQLACMLLREFGVHAPQQRHATTVRLPASADAIALRGVWVVRAGSSLRVVGVAGNPPTRIVVGARQLRVDLGGKLELERVSVAHSDGGSALVNAGELSVVDCSFVHCAASVNAVVRYIEGLAASFGGAALGSFGGAIFQTGAHAKMSATGSVFEDNSVSGTVLSWGGAIGSIGGTIQLEVAAVRRNYALGGRYSSYGGGLMAVFSSLDITGSEFVDNQATGFTRTPVETAGVPDLVPSMYSQGGGAWLQNLEATVRSTTFEANVASGGWSDASGGALWLHSGVRLELTDSLLRRNEARGGGRGSASSYAAYAGAIQVNFGAYLSAANTTFDANTARDA